MGRPAIAAFSLILLTAAADPPPAPPLVPHDYHRLETIADPSFSPDGTRIAYSVSINDAKRDKATSDIWTVPFAGGPPVPLTRTEASEWQPRFSPDGASLFFLRDTEAGGIATQKGDADEDKNETQLWQMPAAGGPARRVTNLPGGISFYALAPDGKRAVVIAEVGRAVGSKTKTPPPIETERFLFKEDGRGYLDDRTQQMFVVDLASGAATQLTQGARDHWLPAWSPDGRLIAYVAKDQGDADRTLNYDVYVLSSDGGTPRRISSSPGGDADPGWGSGPQWSPDSKRLVWLEGGEDKWIYYAPHRLAIADLATGTISRPARIDAWFYAPRFAPDGSLLSLIEQDRTTWLARIDPATGAIRWLTSGPRVAQDYTMAADGRIALLDGDDRTPPELYAVKGMRALTHHNEWLKGRRLGDVREIAFRSGDAEIHGLLVLPPGHDPAKRYPLIAALHGGPVSQFAHEFTLDPLLYAAAGYAVLKVNPRGSSGRGFDFSRAIYADWGNLDVKDISAGISHAIDAGIADPDRIAAAGWSYGGILTGYMIASDRRIKAASAGAGVSNVLATWGVDMYAREYLLELGTPSEGFETWRKLAYPFLHPERISAPTLFMCAGSDDNVPCTGAQQMYQTLKVRGLPTRLVVYPGENHGLTVPSYRIHRVRSQIDWFDHWLKQPPVTAAR